MKVRKDRKMGSVETEGAREAPKGLEREIESFLRLMKNRGDRN